MIEIVKSALAAVCAGALLAGCGGGAPDAGGAKAVAPEVVALEYMKGMQSGKVDEAYLKAHCTEGAAKIIGEMLSTGREGLMSELEGVKLSVDDVKVEGDSARVTLRKDGPQGKGTDTIELRKVNGEWKVDVEPSW